MSGTAQSAWVAYNPSLNAWQPNQTHGTSPAVLGEERVCPSQKCCWLCTGGVFGLFVALTGERMPGGAVAMAEGNALGKGPVIFHLFDSGIELIRRKAAGGPFYAPPPPPSQLCMHAPTKAAVRPHR